MGSSYKKILKNYCYPKFHATEVLRFCRFEVISPVEVNNCRKKKEGNEEMKIVQYYQQHKKIINPFF
jgi:hypothetical protein